MAGRVPLDYIATLLDYDAATGRFTWKHRPDAPNGWNTRFAGVEAFAYATDQTGARKAQVTYEGPRYSMSGARVAWALHHGAWPKHEAQHLNGDLGDNRIANLVDRPHAYIQQTTRPHKNNTSKVRGVTKQRGRFHASIRHRGQSIYLGRFKTLEEGRAARAEAEKRLWAAPAPAPTVAGGAL